MAGEKRPFGIMGSSIAACWMMLELDGRVDFFVDEDPHRVGHELTGLADSGPSRCLRAPSFSFRCRCPSPKRSFTDGGIFRSTFASSLRTDHITGRPAMKSSLGAGY